MTRAMYAAWIDCRRGDAPAVAGILAEALDGFGIPWNGSETGAEWRTAPGRTIPPARQFPAEAFVPARCPARQERTRRYGPL